MRASRSPERGNAATELGLLQQASDLAQSAGWRVLRGKATTLARKWRSRSDHSSSDSSPITVNRGSTSEEAGGGNRTHVISLEGWSSTIELRPQGGAVTPSE